MHEEFELEVYERKLTVLQRIKEFFRDFFKRLLRKY